MYKKALSFICFIVFFIVNAYCVSKSALFIGNSYTYENNLPLMVSKIALSTGDTLLYDSNTIGGYSLQEHSANATTLKKITDKRWDFVVLQEHSQRPSNLQAEVETLVNPYVEFLDEYIKNANICTQTVLYMTWGRKTVMPLDVKKFLLYAHMKAWTI